MGNQVTHVHLEVPRLGEFARQLAGVLSSDIESCLWQQQREGGRLGELLIARGKLTFEQLQAAIQAQAKWAARMHSRDLQQGSFPIATTFSLCMPCYNEAAVIADCIQGALVMLPEFVRHFELIIVDDGSHDNTADIVASLASEDSRIRLVQHEQNHGYGAAVASGLRAARGHLVCFVDGDGQFNLLDLPRLLVHAQQAEVVIGYRYQRADRMVRTLNAKCWNFLIRTLLGVRVRDLDCAFKIFPRWVVEQLQLTAQGACINAEIMTQLSRGGVSICEIPVHHYPRYHGTPTGANLRVVAKAFRELPPLWKYRQTSPLAAHGIAHRVTSPPWPEEGILPSSPLQNAPLQNPIRQQSARVAKDHDSREKRLPLHLATTREEISSPPIETHS